MIIGIDKYYVVSGKLRACVIAKSASHAVAEALSLAGFKDQTEIPADYLHTVYFFVDKRGYRDMIPLKKLEDVGGNEYNSDKDTGLPVWKILLHVGLDRFDREVRSFDPFCQDEYYRELGEDDE